MVKIAGSYQLTMALFSDGTAACWGINDGDCAHPVADFFFSPTWSAGITCATDVWISGNGGWARWYDGTARIFATRYELMEAVGGEPGPMPVEVPELSDVRAGIIHDFAHVVDGDGAVFRWGSDFGPVPAIGEPTAVAGIPPALTVVGGAATCILAADGSVWCWGHNADGQLGDGTTEERGEPSRVVGFGAESIVEVSGLGLTFGAVDSAGRLWMWGIDHRAKSGEPYQLLIPTLIGGLPPLRSVSVGGGASCALTRSKEVYCWGAPDAGYGPNKMGGGDNVSEPIHIAGGTDVEQVTVGLSVICMLKTDGSVWCLGDPVSVGDGESFDFEWGVPVRVDLDHIQTVPVE